MSLNQRIRGRTLQELRRRHFAMYPLCVRCEEVGRITLATQLDHIVALGNGGADVPSNRQGLCVWCHAIKTAEDFGLRMPVRIGLDGYPIKEEKAVPNQPVQPMTTNEPGLTPNQQTTTTTTTAPSGPVQQPAPGTPAPSNPQPAPGQPTQPASPKPAR